MPIPGPSENAEVWDAVDLGPGTLPPVASEGTASVKVRPKAKLDGKRKGGARKPTTTVAGRELAEVTITLRFAERIWPDIEAAILRLQPGSGPHKIGHPKTRLAGIEAVSIESYEGPDWDDYQVGTVIWHCKEWAPPPPAKEAPTAAKKPMTAVPFENTAWPVASPKVAFAQKGIAQLFASAAEQAIAEAHKP
jgi:hypothetical protein